MNQRDAVSKATPAWRRRLFRAALWALGCAVFVLVAGELLVRFAIRIEYPGFRDPAHYTHAYCDDDYHKLRFYWQRTKDLHPGTYVQDPLLGWVPDAPDGLRDSIDDRRPLIALFGDSFAAGVPPTPLDERIAAELEKKLPAGQVVDYAVAGYGLDQIYLRFQQAVSGDAALPDTAVVGLLLEDIDRVIEHFRAGPKPYFEIVDGELELRGAPIRQTPEEWLKENPPAVPSFFLALLIRKLSDWREGTGTAESRCRREEKERLSRRILEELVALARERNVSLELVLLYGEANITWKSWREDFLKESLAAIGADFIDTRAFLLAAAADEGAQLSDFYFPLPNGHLNSRGNAVVAAAIYRRIGEAYGWISAQERRWQGTIELGAKGRTEIEYQGIGFEYSSDTFSWTSNAKASIRLPAPPEPMDIVLRLELLCALTRPGDERTLKIRLGDTTFFEKRMADFPECWASPYTVELPVDDAMISGPTMTVTLELPYLVTPIEAGYKNGDTRHLGVAVKSLTVRPAVPEVEPPPGSAAGSGAP